MYKKKKEKKIELIERTYIFCCFLLFATLLLLNSSLTLYNTRACHIQIRINYILLFVMLCMCLKSRIIYVNFIRKVILTSKYNNDCYFFLFFFFKYFFFHKQIHHHHHDCIHIYVHKLDKQPK